MRPPWRRGPLASRDHAQPGCVGLARDRWVLTAVALTLVGGGVPAGAQQASSDAKPPLRVCADPNDLPFSNQARQGFENAIAERLAHDLGTTVQFVWYPERRSFLRRTMNAGRCDLIMGVPTGDDRVEATIPYYESSYVFVSRADRHYGLRSLDDPRLRQLRIGIHIIGDDYANAPGAEALATRHIVNNVVGYSVYGDYSKPNPEAHLVDAVAHGDVDVAIVWGPLAGYFASRESVPLTITPVTPARDAASGDRFVYDIAMGVPRGDRAAAQLVDSLIVRDRSAIQHILQQYGVPQVSPATHGGLVARALTGGGHTALATEEAHQ